MAIPKAGPEPLGDLAAFLEPFAALLRRSESRQTLERYVTGLLADLPRKTASDMGRSLPETNHQRLQELLTRTAWEVAEMDRLRMGLMSERASVGEGVLIVDDTGLPKKGTHSVGVARQYSGTLGRIDNCQVLVTSHYVDAVFDWPLGARLYLPKSWTENAERLQKADVPEDVAFQTKGAIALELTDRALEAGLRLRAAVADAGYGDQPLLLDGWEARSMPYLVAVGTNWSLRPAEAVEADPGEAPPAPKAGRGRPKKASSLKDRIPSVRAGTLLAALPEEAWQVLAWRNGEKGPLVKSFACVRVYRTRERGEHHPSSGYLIGERPLAGHRGDEKQYFAWGLDDLSLTDLVDLAHVRWVIERFYQDAKGELGLDDYEGRRWHGLHRHVALVMLAHSFMTLRQSYGPETRARNGPEDTNGGTTRVTPPARGFPPKGAPKRRRAQAMRS
jgi:SRSO17 transposase